MFFRFSHCKYMVFRYEYKYFQKKNDFFSKKWESQHFWHLIALKIVILHRFLKKKRNYASCSEIIAVAAYCSIYYRFIVSCHYNLI